MAIYSMYGVGPLEILKTKGIPEEGGVLIARRPDGALREYHIWDLRADDGINEILDSIKALPEREV